MDTRKTVLKERDKTHGRSIIPLLDAMLLDAQVSGASDVHVHPAHDALHVRLRIDGLLSDAYTLPLPLAGELIARLKILSGLRTDEHFAAQDGRFVFHHGLQDEITVRISIMPTYYGENAVLRLLSAQPHEQTLTDLGMSGIQEKLALAAISRSHGLILVTGPTGSGKTTTLYTLMHVLADTPASLVSIEDPVEYALPKVTQVQAQPNSGLTFANGLRALLRQDPDVIMVGEIRDAETARLGMNAALTGHLVLSTLHTNDALSTLPRLVDMGAEPYLIASTARLIIAQRLVRKLCTVCSQEYLLSRSDREELAAEFGEIELIPDTHRKSFGCEACNGTGYRGRVGLFEVLPISPRIRNALTAHKRLWNMSAGVPTLLEDGLQKVGLGLTTFEELLRIRHA